MMAVCALVRAEVRQYIRQGGLCLPSSTRLSVQRLQCSLHCVWVAKVFSSLFASPRAAKPSAELIIAFLSRLFESARAVTAKGFFLDCLSSVVQIQKAHERMHEVTSCAERMVWVAARVS